MFLIFLHAEGTVFGLAIRNPELTASGPRQPNLKEERHPAGRYKSSQGRLSLSQRTNKSKNSPRPM